MDEKATGGDVAAGDEIGIAEEVEMVKFFDLLKKFREARDRLRDQQRTNQVTKTTKSFDNDDELNTGSGKKRKTMMKSEGTSGTSRSEGWIGSFEKEDFFATDQSYDASISSTVKNNNNNNANNPMMRDNRVKRHHDDQPDDGRLNLNLTL